MGQGLQIGSDISMTALLGLSALAVGLSNINWFHKVGGAKNDRCSNCQEESTSFI